MALVLFESGLPLAAEPEPTPLPRLTLTAAEQAAKDVDAVSGATTEGEQPLKPNFLGIPVSVNAHRVTGYIAGGLLAAAGAVGIYRFLDLRRRGHEYRDSEDESSDDSQSCDPIITEVWNDGQAVRWTHVGLVVAGESLYVFDAVTGISLMKQTGGKSRAGIIHRNAFLVHAGLMALEVITGILETNALERGNHDQVVGYGAIHAGIGVAIPVIIIGSGLMIDNGWGVSPQQ
jgi:hypothetical protein